MRLLATADLHHNHRLSRPLAEDLIGQMNSAGGDVLLIIGDSAIADPPYLEECLSLFRFNGPKLFVPGNHELWTTGDDSYTLFKQDLPRRLRDISWHWLQDEPFYLGEVAVVGSIGWYDYSFAQPGLGIPRRFYEQKIAPGSASRDDDLSFLFDQTDDIAPSARDIFARWNDGRHIKLHRSDDAFVQELLAQLEGHLIETSRKATRIVVATHMLPFAELLPGPHNSQWDFAKAYLGSDRFGELLLRFPKITHALCGHSHFPAEAQVRHIRALNIGSGYRWKTFVTLDV